MIYFLLGLLATVFLFLCFKVFDNLGIDTFQAIVVNYAFCIITGLIFLGDLNSFSLISIEYDWVKVALLLGSLFISIFYLMALTAQKVSVAASSMAAKLSLIIPVIISLMFLGGDAKQFDVWNYAGLVLVFIAIPMASAKPKNIKKESSLKGWQTIMLPFAVFIGAGTIDSLINWSNAQINIGANASKLQAIFPIITFSVAFSIGLVVFLIKKMRINLKSFLGGAVLGVFNYFSIYFLFKALDSFGNNGAFVFPNFNMGVIILSSLLAVVLFKERLYRINQLGILFSVLAIFLISYQEILKYLK